MGGYYPVQLSKPRSQRAGFQRPRQFAANQNVGRAQPGPTKIPGYGTPTPGTESYVERGVRAAIVRGAVRVAGASLAGPEGALIQLGVEAIWYWYLYNRSQLKPGYVGRPLPGYSPCGGVLQPCAGTVATHHYPSGACFTNCPTGQGIGTARPLTQAIPAGEQFTGFIEHTHDVAGSPRYRIVQIFRRSSPFPAMQPQYWYDPAYYYPPSWVPSVYPETIPIGLPVSTPLPAPFRQLNARRNYRLGMAEARQAGYQLGRVEAVGASPAPPGSVIIDVGASGQVKTRLTLKTHLKKPPKRGERERKSRSDFQPTQAQRVALGALTEGGDGIEALWNALPYDYRKGRSNNEFYYDKKLARWMLPSYNMMVEDLWDHPELIDRDKAMFNLAVMMVGDAAIGRLSRASHKSWYNSAYGAMRAPRAGPYLSFTN